MVQMAMKHGNCCFIDIDTVRGSAVVIVRRWESTEEAQKCCSVMAWSATRHGYECALSTSTPLVNDETSD